MEETSDNDDPNDTQTMKRKISLETAIQKIKRIRLNSDGVLTTVEMIIGPEPMNGETMIPIFREMSLVNKKVDRKQFRRVGPYILGPKIGSSPVDNIVQYLAKKEGTNEFVQLKILILSNDSPIDEVRVLADRLGKMLMHNELSMLSMLAGHKGVVQSRGLFTDKAYEEDRFQRNPKSSVYTGLVKRRLVLALDCLTPHEFCAKSQAYIDLQQHMLNMKRLKECEYVSIFRNIVSVVESLHRCDIVHRDLKPANLILNLYSNEVTLVNFCLATHLLGENDLLHDQQGSPAYISPEVLSGQPYKGKPIDVWAMGVILYMMVYGEFPFYDASPVKLFKKIKSGEYVIPMELGVSFETQDLIKSMLTLNPDNRVTAPQVLTSLDKMLIQLKRSTGTIQAVPKMPKPIDDSKKRNLEQFCRRHEAFDQMVPLTRPPIRYTLMRAINGRKRAALKIDSPLAIASHELSSVPFQQLTAIGRPSPPHNCLQSRPPTQVVDPAVPSEPPTLTGPESLALRRNAMSLANQMYDAMQLYDTNTPQIPFQRMYNFPDVMYGHNYYRQFPNRRRGPGPRPNLISPSALSATIQMMPQRRRVVPNHMISEMVRWAISPEPLRGSILHPLPTVIRNPRRALVRPPRRNVPQESFEQLWTAIRARPVTVNDRDMLPFSGTVSFEFSRRLSDFMLFEHGTQDMVKEIFGDNRDNLIANTYTFIRRCDFKVDDNFMLCRQQSDQQLDMLRTLFSRIGFEHRYFQDPAAIV